MNERQRRVVISTVAVAMLGAATALTLPALAGTEPDTGSTGASAKPPVSPKMLAALQRDLGLSAEQAGARLQHEASAIQTRKALARTLGTAYGGAWLNADGTQLTVAVTNPDRADAVRAAGAEPKVVTRSARQLDAIKQNLDRQADRAAASVPGWYVDPATNSVVVLSTPKNTAAARSFVAGSGVAADAVRIVSTTARPTLLSAPKPSAPPVSSAPAASTSPAADSLVVRGGDPYIIDDVARCSVGFAVEGGFISAGHCGQQGSTTTGLDGDQQVPQGTFEASTFPESDFSFVATNADWTPVGEVNSFGGETATGNDPVATSAGHAFGFGRRGGHGSPGVSRSASPPPAAPSETAPLQTAPSETAPSDAPPADDGALPVAGSEEAPIGTSVCKFGSTTGASCGVIQALDVTVNFADPEGGNGTVTVNGLIQTDVCAEAGDSGGSLLAGDQAQGTVSGGSGDCRRGGQTFFQPINEVLQALDLTLLTTS